MIDYKPEYVTSMQKHLENIKPITKSSLTAVRLIAKSLE